MESDSGNVDTSTFYALVRKLESTGVTEVKLTYHELKRKSVRAPGERDSIDITCTKEHDFVVKKLAGDRTAESHKTAFALGLKKDTFPSVGCISAPRLRWEKVGKNLKPTKPHILTKTNIHLLSESRNL